MHVSVGRKEKYILGRGRTVSGKSKTEGKVHVWGFVGTLMKSYFKGLEES